jgi:hypothetical protein
MRIAMHITIHAGSVAVPDTIDFGQPWEREGEGECRAYLCDPHSARSEGAGLPTGRFQSVLFRP